MSRAKKGSTVIKKTKTVTYNIIAALITNSKDLISVKSDNAITTYKNSDIPIMDLASTGSNLTKHSIENVLKQVVLKSYLKAEKNNEKAEINEKSPEKYKELTLDDFINDFKI